MSPDASRPLKPKAHCSPTLHLELDQDEPETPHHKAEFCREFQAPIRIEVGLYFIDPAFDLSRQGFDLLRKQSNATHVIGLPTRSAVEGAGSQICCQE